MKIVTYEMRDKIGNLERMGSKLMKALKVSNLIITKVIKVLF